MMPWEGASDQNYWPPQIGFRVGRIFWRKIPRAWEARSAVYFEDCRCMTRKEIKATKDDPFHDDFTDPFAVGIGQTKRAATVRLVKDVSLAFRQTIMT